MLISVLHISESDKKIQGTKTNANLATSISSDQNNYVQHVNYTSAIIQIIALPLPRSLQKLFKYFNSLVLNGFHS